MKTIVKNQYEILENKGEMLYRTNLNGLLTGMIRNLGYLDQELDESLCNELDTIYDILLLIDQKGIKEIYFEDCQNKKIINTISKQVDDYYINEILDSILLILHDIHLYHDTSLIDLIFNERYMKVINDYYNGKHSKQSFEKALELD